MTKTVRPKITTLKESKQSTSSIGNLEALIKLCRENKINQLNLPDGTMINMHPLAFYDPITASQPLDSNFPTINDLDSDIIDDDVLFASAR